MKGRLEFRSGLRATAYKEDEELSPNHRSICATSLAGPSRSSRAINEGVDRRSQQMATESSDSALGHLPLAALGHFLYE
jgi:hypothetical protein